MAKTYYKKFEIQGHKFITKIELDQRIEKRLNGRRFHLITTSYLGAQNWEYSHEIETSSIVGVLEMHKHWAKAKVNSVMLADKQEAEKILINEGFTTEL